MTAKAEKLLLSGLQPNPELARAASAALRCGVTRLADVTHLDTVGVPVVQAVRPWSRALSVHQGKGLTREAAALGALMEAVESHFAEAFAGPAVCCDFQGLPPDERAETLGDFASDRRSPPADHEPLGWIGARTIPDGATFWLPFDLVSLDLSRRGDARIDRSSDGLASHFDSADAETTAVLEVLERDAVAGFLALPPWGRAELRVDIASAETPWLSEIQQRIDASGVHATLYLAPAVVDLPVFICELSEPCAEGLPRGRVFGSACHPDAGTAIRKAVLEALQSRLTAISGARDDIIFDPEEMRVRGFGFSLPLPSGVAATPWSSLAGRWVGDAASPSRLAALLRQAGYGTTAVVDLAPQDLGVVVVKAFVPGLGSNVRQRRSPSP